MKKPGRTQHAGRAHAVVTGPLGNSLQVAGTGSSQMRNYILLSESLITGLVGSLGIQSGKMILRDVGVRTGESAAENLLMKGNFVRDPESFAKIYVEGLLKDMGANPRLLKVGPSSVEFEQSRCPFVELADKFPALICDVLDEAVHEGIDRKSGLKTTRLACMGHGEPTCRFRTTWPAPPRRA